MKVRDIRINSQLSIGFGFILVVFAILGYISWKTSNDLWINTKALYDHPLTIRRSVNAIDVDVFSINRNIVEYVIEDRSLDKSHYIQDIDIYEADAYKHFDILYANYLGSKSDIDSAYESFVHWKSIRDETIRLVNNGDYNGATIRIRDEGVDGTHTSELIGYLSVIDDFAINKGDALYADSVTLKNNMILQLSLIIVIAFLSLGIIGYVLRKRIMTPLKELTVTTQAIKTGNLSARSSYGLKNEFGLLSDTFNLMAENIEKEIQNKTNINRISKSMHDHETMWFFCRNLLEELITNTGSKIGAIYFLNEDKTHYDYFESIGMNAKSRAAFEAKMREGEFGGVLASGEIQQIKDIGEDTRFVFSEVTGDFYLKEIITIPLVDDADIIAIISLASLGKYSGQTIKLLNDVRMEMAMQLRSTLAVQQIKEYSKKLQDANFELEARSKELSMQSDELTEQNIELEMQKKQLDEASRLKSSFLSNMSHELRTPLNSVIALASVLNRRLRGVIPGEDYGYIDVIERNGRQLLTMVNDILDLSRIESGREEVIKSNFMMQDLARELVDLMKPQYDGKGVALENKVSEKLPPMKSDLGKCRHILQNILGNALKFTDEGKVVISAALFGDEIRVSVKDTGIGIAPDKLRYIFDEFRQADESTSKRSGGTGLGLAIADKYAKLLGGSVEVKSALGKGSVFMLRLPVNGGAENAEEDEEEKGFYPYTGPVEQGGTGEKVENRDKSVLLVEDSEPAIIQMVDILIEQGYGIQIARNGKEALKSVEKALPDAIILDLMMPEVDGFQVLEAIRAGKSTAHIPILILTAKHVSKDELKFLKGNHIFQLIQKGSVGKSQLLKSVKDMVNVPTKPAAEIAAASERSAVLIVEDNPDSMKMVRATLQNEYDILEAIDGPNGIDLAKSRKPAVVLLDISLPGMDGYQVLKEIRKDERTKYIPVIALIAQAMDGDREEMLEFGFDDYLSKPIDDELLKKTIRRFIYAK